MLQETIKSNIWDELRKLNRDQIVHFTWRCAVYALPLLGDNGNFNFWDIEKRQKYIYSIFYALDINAADYADFADHTDDAAKAAFNAAEALDAANYTNNDDVAYIANVTALFAANVAYTNSDYYSAHNAVNVITSAKNKKNIDIESLILKDLRILQGRKKQHISTELYGKMWDNFQKALKAEGCGYWGKLYKNIFDNQLVLDQKALKTRLNVPIEIRKQGAAAVAILLEEIEEKGSSRLNEARIIILGDKGAGKTCIAKRLINPKAPMTTNKESTAGVDTTLWKLKKENISIRIWDFAGHTITHTVHQFFLSERCLYLIVYDGRTEERNRLEYWLNHMKNYGGDSKAIILVNKRDQHSVDIPINSLKEQYLIEKVYTFSIKDDKTDLKAFRHDIAEYIKNNPSWNTQEIPTNYYQVKEELEKIFVKGEKEKGQEHITKEKFKKIAQKYDVVDTEKLLTDLHALGVSLWYKHMAKYNTLVLNPEWISHGVYKIINWVNEERKHTLTLDEFTSVFSEDRKRYSTDRHEFLFDLMKHYELAYETKKEKSLIIPHLLKEDRPKELPPFPMGESLMLRYKSELPLPPNTISRFIVRHNHQIKKKKNYYIAWRYGVLLEDGKGCWALVREDDRTISVSVKGQDKSSYLSTLRETLNDIFNSYKSKKPELQYRIERFGQISDEIETQYPLWLSDSKIINHSKDNIPYYEDITKQNIDLNYTVQIYNINTNNLMLDGHGNQFFLDRSTHTTFNFENCNINLQGNLNDLAQLLKESGNKEEAKELIKSAKALKEAKECKTKEEVKEKGIVNRLQRLVNDLEDKNSTLHKTVRGVKHGINIAQNIAKGYNSIAQWLGMPQVPKPFLD
jgi:GTPase SAR1 family protein